MAGRTGAERERNLVLGARLRQLREGLGLVLQDVADLFETSRNVPSQWEGGAREPSYESLIKLADFYGVTTDWLLGREGAERDSPRVKQIKSRLGDYLRLREAGLQGTTPAQRIRVATEFLEGEDSVTFHKDRIARQLLISPDSFRQMLVNQMMATELVIQRFAQLTNLPELWFYQPTPQLEDASVKYRHIVERFLAEGLDPDQVEQRVWGAKRRTGRQRRTDA